MGRIMIVDDDVALAASLAAALQKAGHEVSTLDTTDGAIAALVQAKPDLLILDVMFPDNPVAGFDLARQIRATREIKKLPVILLTGVNQEFPMSFSAADIDPAWLSGVATVAVTAGASTPTDVTAAVISYLRRYDECGIPDAGKNCGSR